MSTRCRRGRGAQSSPSVSFGNLYCIIFQFNSFSVALAWPARGPPRSAGATVRLARKQGQPPDRLEGGSLALPCQPRANPTCSSSSQQQQHGWVRACIASRSSRSSSRPKPTAHGVRCHHDARSEYGAARAHARCICVLPHAVWAPPNTPRAHA